MWWYNIAKFTVKPNLSVYNDGLRRKIIQYAKVPQSISAFQACLTAGNPIVGGFTVFQSFMNTGSDGMVVMPEGDESVLGGHAICIVGFDAAKRVWIVRNSWGKNWGDNGYGYFPYEYLTSPGLAADFWTATSISNN
jgi:C1A family cysteine protease